MMRLHAVLFCASLLLATGCADPGGDWPPETTHQGIIGGATTTDWDSVVMLYMPTPGNTCTGFVVAPDVVVTAGYCLDGVSGAIQVMWCDDCMASQDLILQSTDYHQHPSYDPMTWEGMVAVVVLPSDAPGAPLDLNQDVPDASWVSANTPLRTVGFGSVDTQGNGSGVKREVDIAFDGWDAESLTHEDGVHGFCSGDGGGPVLTDHGGDWAVAGVAIGGAQDCVSFGSATRIDGYIPWVMSFSSSTGDDDTGDDDTGGDDDTTGDDDDDTMDDDDVDDDDATDDDDAADDDSAGGTQDCSCQTAGTLRLAPAAATAFLALCAIGALYRGRSRRS